jgi:hypothetical protein
MHRNHIRWILALGLGLGLAWSAPAQVIDLQTGRGADLTDEAKYSVEGGLVAGDVDYFGTRFNARLGARWLVGANLGIADVGDDETTIGVYGLYQFNINAPVALAIKGGYDTTLDSDTELTDISVIAIVSGPIKDNMDWYANAGFHRVEIEIERVTVGGIGIPVKADDDDIAPVLGGGIVFYFNEHASAYGGIDLLLGDIYDDTVLGGGFRWSF